MIQEPVVELTIHQEPAICRMVELRPANAMQTGPRARMVVARLNSQPSSFNSQRQAGHQLLRFLVRHTLAGCPLDVQLGHSASGSPELMINGALSRFSVSIAHSKQWLAAGLAENGAVGVDIEIDAPRENAQALARWLAWENPGSGAEHFIQQWVLWEACAKCAQQSMLKKQNPGFTVLQAALSKRCFGISGAWAGWRDQIEDEVQFAMALCADSPGQLEHRKLDPNRLAPWDAGHDG